MAPAPRFGSNLSGVAGWSLPSTGFSNPSYLGPPSNPNVSTADALGFDISTSAGVTFYFFGTYTGATVVHEQTLDPTGAGGWFAVYGQVVSNTPTTPSAGFCTSGQAYQFPSAGVLHRIRVTALSTGTLQVAAVLSSVLFSQSSSGGGGGGTSGGTATAANPSYTEGATQQPLSLTLFGAQRVMVLDSTGVPVDYTLAAPVKGSIASGSTASDAPVVGGGRAANANPTAVANGQVVAAMLDLKGRGVVMPHQVRELVGDASLTLTSTTTATTLVLAQGAGVITDLVSVTLVNTGTATVVQILNDDGTTVRWTGYCPATDMRGIVFPVVLKGAAANVTWKAKSVTSTNALTITAQYVLNT